MAKLTRFTMPVFAGSAAQTQTSVFGSMKTSPQYTSNVAESINTAAYSNGWFDAVEIGYAPFIEDCNTLNKAITYQISYGQQQGIPEWASDTEYFIGSLVKLNTASGSEVYSSLIDNNIGNLLSDTTSWKKVFDSNLQTQLNQKATPEQITTAINTVLASLYPVGSLYMGTQNTCPLVSLISGSEWELVAANKAIWTSNGNNANTTIAAGLPNITGRIGGLSYDSNDAKNGMNGAFYWGNTEVRGAGDGAGDRYGYFDASRSSSIYGKSSTVQPPAYRVNLWRRTA